MDGRTFASPSNPTRQPKVSLQENQQQSFKIRKKNTRPASDAHLVETRNARDEFLPTKNVAPRADFDTASRTEASAACGSQLVYVDGRSRLAARRRSRPSKATSLFGVVRAMGRRDAAGGWRVAVGARAAGGRAGWGMQTRSPLRDRISSTKVNRKKGQRRIGAGAL